MTFSNSLNINTSGVVVYDNTTGVFTQSAITQHDTLVAGASNAIVSVGTGTAGQVLTSNGPGADPSYQAVGLTSYVNVTSATQTMAVNTGYVTNDPASLITYTPPATCAVGTRFAIVGNSSNGWTLDLAANSQTFNFGNTPGTVAVTSQNRYDAIEFVCTVANLVFSLSSSVGNPSVS